MTSHPSSNSLAAARNVLLAATPEDKVATAAEAAANWPDNPPAVRFPSINIPDRPARPSVPVLASPTTMPKRRLSTTSGRIALLHAVAHIEFNAIDLAFDMAARFATEIQEAELNASEFVSDWFSVGADEARHFHLICDRLAKLGAKYGDLPAHDGLWEAAQNTADSALARLAIAPLVLEARGLDVTPMMIEKLENVKDFESAAVLKVIYDEEVGHVAKGRFWFDALCQAQGLSPQPTFRRLVCERFAGELKPPFNHEARTAAGMPQSYYV